MKNHNKEVGARGEELACRFLEKQGYKIIGQNLKTGYKELDIIARKKDLLVIVEVKTRTSFKYGAADEAMTERKIRNLKQAAGSYLDRAKINFRDLRFDFIAVDIDDHKKTFNISHYKDII